MSNDNQITAETYIRLLPHRAMLHLCSLLDIGDHWQTLALKIPTDHKLLNQSNSDFDSSEFLNSRYSYMDIECIIKRNQQRGLSCTKALLVDWGTKNTKVKHLLQALRLAELTAAANYIHNLVSTTSSPPVAQRLVSSNASDRIVVVENVLLQNDAPPVDSLEPNETTGESEIPVDIHLKDVKYDVLKKITNNFDDRTVKDGGKLIGNGGFGTVFLGTFNTGFQVAVKCLKDTEDTQNQFKNELETLCQYKHDNLVLLLGYSIDGDTRCLIYQYMCNGSLEDRLACIFDTPPITNTMRFEIAKGTARGITYLHEGGLIHRDIKSANILLDNEFNPKVGDFATAKVLPTEAHNQTVKASVVIGTHAYLAPEALSFIIHPGLDCFSYGVVLLEILTGLPVFDPGRENPDIKIHVQEFCAEGEDGEVEGTIFDLLDQKGGQWDSSMVDTLYSISCRCQESKKNRPTMADILSELEAIKVSSSDC